MKKNWIGRLCFAIGIFSAVVTIIITVWSARVAESARKSLREAEALLERTRETPPPPNRQSP